MIFNLYSVKDRLSGFAIPLPFQDGDKADEAARRHFMTMLRSNQMMKDTPSDFELYKVGIFSPETGTINPCKLELIEKGANIQIDNESK